MHADIMLFRSLNSSVVRGAGAGDIMHRTGQSDEASQSADELTWRDELSPRSTLTLRYDVEVTAADDSADDSADDADKVMLVVRGG